MFYIKTVRQIIEEAPSMLKLMSDRYITGSRCFGMVLAAMAASYGLSASPAIAQPLPSRSLKQISQPMENTLRVTGQGSESIPTTLTQVTLGVLVEAATAQAAQQQAAQQSTAVIEALQSQTVERLETTGISLSPRYEYTDDRQILRGYQATNSISFKAPTAQAGDIIDKAVNAGATQIDGISFVAEDATIETARQSVLSAAVEDAQQQANTVLAALGLSSQSVVNIEIGPVNEPPPQYGMRSADAANFAEAASTPILGQTQTISAQVTLTIKY